MSWRGLHDVFGQSVVNGNEIRHCGTIRRGQLPIMAVTTFRAPCTIITLRELRHWPPCVNPLLPRMRSWVCRQFRRSVSSLVRSIPALFPRDTTRVIGSYSNSLSFQSHLEMDDDHNSTQGWTGERELMNKKENGRWKVFNSLPSIEGNRHFRFVFIYFLGRNGRKEEEED